MVSVTFTVDPTILEAARREAERRNITLDQFVADSLAASAPAATPAEDAPITEREKNRRELLELMYSSPLGEIDRPLTREEIYAERTWPRS